MEVYYLAQITKPETSIVHMTMKIQNTKDKLSIFLPSWSPGSYLMREYPRHVKNLKVQAENGDFVYFEKLQKGEWEIDFTKSDFKGSSKNIEVNYEVYCHELTVRTSHIDYSHAFLHGPTYIMGVKDHDIKPTIEFRFVPLWSKLHTALEEISKARNEFIFTADNYDDLVDSPVEIGCHESDGFMVDGKEHHLIFYGETYPHGRDLKADMKKIVETVASHFSSIPYEKYLFITHFKKNLYGGLEHHDSTALHFDGRKLVKDRDYQNFLSLVAHEYFHTWNVKRIRPKELGPFDYQNENYTKMHWLTEGLTSFMDDLFVLKAGLSKLEDYLFTQTRYLKRLYSVPGRKFQTLEESSYDTWIKLYRPDESSDNTSVSYYLKGGLVFKTLHFEFVKKGKSMKDLLTMLWDRYLENPNVGVTEDEVFDMIKNIGGEEVFNKFYSMLTTTEDIDFEKYYKEFGGEFVYDESEEVDLGITVTPKEVNLIISKVALDGPAYKAGLNPGDEIVAINGLRVLNADYSDFKNILKPNQKYDFTISRLNRIYHIEVMPGMKPRELKEIKVLDHEKLLGALLA